MIIYKAEASIDGLADRIKANQSISYSSVLKPWHPSQEMSAQRDDALAALRSVATVHGQSLGSALDNDLFFTKSILVSTNWNKNDDVFTPAQVWSARHTPTHKPTNIEHDETRMVGHITETWALDSEGNLIPDNTCADDLPSLFHIANGAVIYTNWQDNGLVERTNQLIAKINSGDMHVSMEAFFTNFDYAVTTPEGSNHIVARNEETAFLTKHLRIYGGEGEFEGCKVGRVLKNITFSGKGYVEKPANPYSVIFEDGNVFNHSTASTESPFDSQSGVLISYSSNSNSDKTENTSMADTNDLLKTQLTKAEAEVADLKAELKEAVKANTEAGVKALQNDIESLGSKLEAAEKELDEAKAQVETLTSEKATLSEDLTKANEAKADLENKIAEAEVAKTKADRVSILVDGGVDKEVAEAKVETFAELNDEQFASLAQDLISLAQFGKDKDMDDKKKKDDKKDAKSSDESDESDESQDDEGEVKAEEADLENTEASEYTPDLAVDASDDEAEKSFAALASDISAFLGRETVSDATDSE